MDAWSTIRERIAYLEFLAKGGKPKPDPLREAQDAWRSVTKVPK
jgi:hypothetical protein